MSPKRKIGGEITVNDMRRLDRSISKPLMEKRRRDRINKSLAELKTILIDVLKRDKNSCSKLEKADILEMTVNYLRSSQTRPNTSQNEYETGRQSALEQTIKQIQSNPGLTDIQKTNLIVQIRGEKPTPPPPQPSPPSTTASVATTPLPSFFHHAMLQQKLFQQQLIALQHKQQQENVPPPAKVIKRENSDSEESGFSETSSSDEIIFRPWWTITVTFCRYSNVNKEQKCTLNIVSMCVSFLTIKRANLLIYRPFFDRWKLLAVFHSSICCDDENDETFFGAQAELIWIFVWHDRESGGMIKAWECRRDYDMFMPIYFNVSFYNAYDRTRAKFKGQSQCEVIFLYNWPESGCRWIRRKFCSSSSSCFLHGQKSLYHYESLGSYLWRFNYC